MGIITDREELIVGKMMSEKNERKYFDEYRQMLQIAEEYDCIDVCCAVREITEKAKIYLEDDGKYGLAYIPKEDEKVVLYDWYEFLGSLTITEEKMK